MTDLVELPEITDEIEERWWGTVTLLEEVKGDRERINWTQDAVDFACLIGPKAASLIEELQGKLISSQLQSTTAWRELEEARAKLEAAELVIAGLPTAVAAELIATQAQVERLREELIAKGPRLPEKGWAMLPIAEVDRMAALIERLRGALEHYADEKNWRWDKEHYEGGFDGTAKAREALQERHS